jgi:hypothetical protein
MRKLNETLRLSDEENKNRILDKERSLDSAHPACLQYGLSDKRGSV